MDQFRIFATPIWSVSELNRYLRELIESDDALQSVWVQGEISNLARPASGHIYFTLKDKNSSLRCVVWKFSASRLQILLKDGLAVEAHGDLGVYEVAGQYQLYIDQIRPAGEGLLFQEFIRLKEKLEAEGLFDQSRKRNVPSIPRKIGVVTSLSGAALQDILNTIRRRYPSVEVYISPTAVQGTEAPEEIVNALISLQQKVDPDITILARGGGSIEDLWAFNNEKVARAIAASKCPVITGIGHETDFTIADFVSDLRAPTPTAAAELATPDRKDLKLSLSDEVSKLSKYFSTRFIDNRKSIDLFKLSLRQNSPIRKVNTFRQQLDEVLSSLDRSLHNLLQLKTAHLKGYRENLSNLNPLSVLRRGYAIVSKDDGKVVTSTKQVKTKDKLTIRVTDGEFKATAE